MVSAIMTVQDQRGGPQSNSFLPIGDPTSLDISPHSVKGIQLKEHFTSGDDYAPKVRKPYTITKQRERWTEDEHKKFLEALKLYGRAWRHIEEHVGTKTAVQIRSHAQKFFSKVVRESSGSDASSAKPIEIPPPRPKRKPMHPYPRKLVTPLKIMVEALDQPTTSTSRNSSVSEQENQSPTSVLSRFGSDTIVTVDSNSPNGSPSPVSSPAGIKHSGLSLLESNLTPEENGASVPVDGGSVLDEKAPVKLELFPEDNTYMKEVSAGAGSSQSLKLFGKTVLVIDTHRPSCPTMGTCKSLPPGTNDGRHVQTLPWQLMPMKLSLGNEHCEESASPCGTPRSLYYMQFRNAVMDQAETGSSPTSLWDSYGGASFPSSQLCSPIPVKLSAVDREALGKESQKEGSWSGSNTGSAEVDVDADSGQHPVNKVDSEHKLTSAFRVYETAVKSEGKTGSITSRSFSKGFVPYKRSLAERDTQSSTVTDEEREEQRIRLCL